ncbi:MAG: SDR family oxidoreductase [Cyanobacteria bacterium M_surface_10_m2_119]|nr:SDR family oxidoreductase [Cyanobacteria bacterium M_surface_10_m2_119]
MSDTGVLTTPGRVKPGPRLLVIGGGYTGLRFGRAARDVGFAVLLTSRGERVPEAGLHWLHFDSNSGESGEAGSLDGITHVLVTAAPERNASGGSPDPALALLKPMLQAQPLQWLGYLSTTGVYGDTGGSWVGETSPTHPQPGRSQRRLEAEKAWQNSGLPLQIFRLPAIYGPHRCPFASLREGTTRLIHKPGQVFSRVHVDDIVGALLHCLSLPPARRPGVINICDDVPCPSSESLGYAAHLLGLKLPPVQRYRDIEADLSPMARSFWTENRRASNRLLCGTLGYRLRYPSFREGFQASLAEERAGGVAP